MSETVATNTPAEAGLVLAQYAPLHPRTPAEGPSVAETPAAAAQAPQAQGNNAPVAAPLTGVAAVQEMLDNSAAPTPSTVKRIPARNLTERQKSKLVRRVERSLSPALVVVRDENGKVVTQFNKKKNEWHIKTRLDMNAYAAQGKDNGYAVLARQSGYGNEPVQGNGKTTAKERLHAAFAAAREHLQPNDETKTKDAKEVIKDKKTRRIAAIGGLAVAKVTDFFGKEKPAEKPAEPTTGNTVVRRKVLGQPIVVAKKPATPAPTDTKEMPAVAAAANKAKKPEAAQEQPTRRQKAARRIGIALVAVGLVGAAGYAVYEADKNVAANSQEADDPKVTHADEDKVEQGADNAATDYPKVDVSAQIKHDATPGEVINNVISASKAERTLSLPEDGNIWNSSRAFLEQQGVTPTDVNIDLVADAVRAAKGLSEDDAEELPVDYTFTIPADVLTRVK